MCPCTHQCAFSLRKGMGMWHSPPHSQDETNHLLLASWLSVNEGHTEMPLVHVDNIMLTLS